MTRHPQSKAAQEAELPIPQPSNEIFPSNMCCVLRTGLQLLLFGSDFIENNTHIADDVKKGLAQTCRPGF